MPAAPTHPRPLEHARPRVLSLLPASTEIVCALGGRDLLVGRSHECDYPAGVDQIPACTAPKYALDGTSYQIDQRLKALLQEAVSIYRVDAGLIDGLAPDLILTQSQCEVCAASLKDVQEAACRLLRSRPRILSLESGSLEEVWSDIGRIAAALAAPARGRELVESLQARLSALAIRTAPLPRPTLACIEWCDPLMAAANWVPELVHIAGGAPLFGRAGQHSPWVTWEELHQADPDALVLMPCGFDLERTRQEAAALVQHPQWKTLRAARENRAFLADGNQYFNRPGPRLVESAEILAEILHPTLFHFGHQGAAWEPLAP